MIPNKIDVLRKSYSEEVKAIIAQLAEALQDVVLPTDNPASWQHDVVLDCVLTSTESFLIRQELSLAGWGAVVRCNSSTSDCIRVYIPIV